MYHLKYLFRYSSHLHLNWASFYFYSEAHTYNTTNGKAQPNKDIQTFIKKSNTKKKYWSWAKQLFPDKQQAIQNSDRRIYKAPEKSNLKSNT